MAQLKYWNGSEWVPAIVGAQGAQGASTYTPIWHNLSDTVTQGATIPFGAQNADAFAVNMNVLIYQDNTDYMTGVISEITDLPYEDNGSKTVSVFITQIFGTISSTDLGLYTTGPAGPQGAPGQGVFYAGGWNPSIDYQTYNLVEYSGNTYIALSGNTDQQPDVSLDSWTLFAPQGAQGLTGTQGSAGPQGAQGAMGMQGYQGANGMDGASGYQGAEGPQGASGSQGPQGFTGPQGEKGTAGLQGYQGNQGFQGAQGSTGSQGAQGHQGFQGNLGTQGNQGPVAFGITSGGVLFGAEDGSATWTTNAGNSGQILMSYGEIANGGPEWTTFGIHEFITAATTGENIEGTYTVGADTTNDVGVASDTLTFAYTGDWVVDGWTVHANDRILVKDQTVKAQNGVYLVATVGSAGNDWYLVRDNDTNTIQKLAASLFQISDGVQNGGTTWQCNASALSQLGTDPIVFVANANTGGYGEAGQLLMSYGNIGYNGPPEFVQYNVHEPVQVATSGENWDWVFALSLIHI